MSDDKNNELKNLYQKHWDGLLQHSGDAPAASPLLIKLRDDKYWNADVKVMICGQETYGWNGDVGSKDIDFLMNDYQAILYNDQDYFDKTPGYGEYSSKGARLKRKKGRSFWSRKNFKFFEEGLTNYFKKQDKTVGFVWNNLSKMGNNSSHKNGKGKAVKEVRKLERDNFNILKEEFDILKPNIVIFTTGARDKHIKHHFGAETEFLPKLYSENNILLKKTSNLIAEVKLPEFDNVCALRVQHPSRRTLDNSVIMTMLEALWESRQK